MCYIISNIMYYTAIRCSEIVIYMIMCDSKNGRGLKGLVSAHAYLKGQY